MREMRLSFSSGERPMRGTILKTIIVSGLLLAPADFAAAGSPKGMILHLVKACAHQKQCPFLKSASGKSAKSGKKKNGLAANKELLKFSLKFAKMALKKHK
jgi:hypothetical protein